MKAAYINEPGPPEAIQYGDLPKPEPKGGQVLVRTTAVSVNPVDTYIRNGANYWELPTPFVVGCDLAGVVEAVGPNATRFEVGTRVWGTNQGLLGRQGTFAEYCAIGPSAPPSLKRSTCRITMEPSSSVGGCGTPAQSGCSTPCRAGRSIGWQPITIVSCMPASLCTCFPRNSVSDCVLRKARRDRARRGEGRG